MHFKVVKTPCILEISSEEGGLNKCQLLLEFVLFLRYLNSSENKEHCSRVLAVK